jgi:hypothetical protein
MARSDVLDPAAPDPDEPQNPPPVEYEEGFTIKSIVGIIFICLFMLPGGLYLGLVAGQGVGDAAEWVTIVLFAEVARRSYAPLRKQEIYILFYIAAALTTVVNAERGLGGGPFSWMIWNSYFLNSPASAPFRGDMPRWAVPGADSIAVVGRQLWHPDWFMPIALLLFTDFCGRLSWMGLGYALFRITNDVEKLPFPFAAVAASGATALSEAGTESWRWSIFSTGTVLGLMFGFFYVGIPVLTGTLFGTTFQVLPIPFADYTVAVQNVLPGAIVGLSFSLGQVLFGFVVPFEIILGAAIASILGMVIINPILYNNGLLPNFKFGSDAFMTKLTVDMDFWLSIGIGINISIAILGIALVLKSVREASRARSERMFSLAPPPAGRGDLPIYYAIGAWLFATCALIVLCRFLVPNFPVWILIFFGLLWSPLNSYISARMIGLTGRGISFPYLKEASVVAVGYPKVDIWFAPIPLYDHGGVAQRFREVELTGTKFTSILKAEAFMFPVIMVTSFLFWSFFWYTNPLPSSQFPFAQRFWPVQAQMQSVIWQINLPRERGQEAWFAEAIKPLYMAYGALGGLGLYFLFSLFRLPLLFFYGFAGGLGLFPANTLPQLLGAWFGKKYMAKRYGTDNWVRYAPVLLAGFSCGTGLISMCTIAIALIARAVAKLPY